jgi:hypothetical protein
MCVESYSDVRHRRTRRALQGADDGAMQRDLPDHLRPVEHLDEPSRSMLASRAFWIGGIASLTIWATLLLVAFR